jgi:hypothetical protein
MTYFLPKPKSKKDLAFCITFKILVGKNCVAKKKQANGIFLKDLTTP